MGGVNNYKIHHYSVAKNHLLPDGSGSFRMLGRPVAVTSIPSVTMAVFIGPGA